MPAVRFAATLLVVAAGITLSGCVSLPTATQTATQSAPTPAGAETPAPTPSALGPATESPVPTAPSAESGDAMLDDYGCSLALIETIVFDYDALSYREGFLHPALLDGYDVLCSGTQPSTTLANVERASFAILPADDGVLETIDGRILATGLEPDPIVWGIYQDAATDPIAFLYDGADWQRINETSFVDAERYAVLIWFEKP